MLIADARRLRSSFSTLRPPAAAYREGKVHQRAHDQKYDCRRSAVYEFLPIERFVDVSLAVASRPEKLNMTDHTRKHRIEDEIHDARTGWFVSSWSIAIATKLYPREGGDGARRAAVVDERPVQQEDEELA